MILMNWLPGGAPAGRGGTFNVAAAAVATHQNPRRTEHAERHTVPPKEKERMRETRILRQQEPRSARLCLVRVQTRKQPTRTRQSRALGSQCPDAPARGASFGYLL